MFYEPKDGHGLPRNPFNACVVPRPIAWISTLSEDGVANLAPFSHSNLVSITPPMGMFMLGNFMRESGVVKRLVDTGGGALMNIVTIFLGLAVGATMQAENFLGPKSLMIFAFGMVDFVLCTAGGIWTVQLLNKFRGNKPKMNPLIGSAGVSAVPMAARVSQVVGLEERPGNYLLMHAMGPNLAGVMGTAAAAGMFIAMYK